MSGRRVWSILEITGVLKIPRDDNILFERLGHFPRLSRHVYPSFQRNARRNVGTQGNADMWRDIDIGAVK